MNEDYDIIEPANNSESDIIVYQGIRDIITEARTKILVTVNSAMVEAYWSIGRRIEESVGDRAEYGKGLLRYLSKQLTKEFRKGYTERNLQAMRQFYHMFPILHTLCAELSWSHYRLLMKIEDKSRRDFYVRLFNDKIKQADDNPTIGIILCANKDESIVKYSVLADNENLFASKYMLYLPTEEELKRELDRERKLIEQQRMLEKGGVTNGNTKM